MDNTPATDSKLSDTPVGQLTIEQIMQHLSARGCKLVCGIRPPDVDGVPQHMCASLVGSTADFESMLPALTGGLMNQIVAPESYELFSQALASCAVDVARHMQAKSASRAIDASLN